MSATATTAAAAAATAAIELYKRNASADKRNSFLKSLLSSSRRVSISVSPAAREAVGPAQLSIAGFCREIHNRPDSEHKHHQQPPYWVPIQAQNLEGAEYCFFIYCNIVFEVAQSVPLGRFRHWTCAGAAADRYASWMYFENWIPDWQYSSVTISFPVAT